MEQSKKRKFNQRSLEIKRIGRMKENKLTVKIQKPVETVFEFTTNPENTPFWIDAIEAEETSDWPIKIGTIYKNRNKAGRWSEYIVIALEPNKLFELAEKNGNYHVRYSYRELAKSAAEMEYFEWVEQGEIAGPFTQDILDKLKIVVEKA